MDISYLGKSGFKIKTKNGAAVAEAEALTIAHKAGGEDFVIASPGEYEIEGISVFGYANEGTNVYVIQVEDIRVAYLGNIAKPLTEKSITDLENIDVVIVSVDTMPIKDMVEIVAKLEPYYVLPYGENIPQFVAAYEHGSRVVKSLSLNRLGLSEDLTEVIVFDDKMTA